MSAPYDDGPWAHDEEQNRRCMVCLKTECPGHFPPRRATITDEQLLALQAHAMVIADAKLKVATWVALGNDPRYAFEPTTARERSEAREYCADTLAFMALTGERLRTLDEIKHAA